MNRRAITTPWVIVSTVISIASYVLLIIAYNIVMPLWAGFANNLYSSAAANPAMPVSALGVLSTVTTQLTTSINVAFAIIALGIFVGMMIVGYRNEPTSFESGMF